MKIVKQIFAVICTIITLPIALACSAFCLLASVFDVGDGAGIQQSSVCHPSLVDQFREKNLTLPYALSVQDCVALFSIASCIYACVYTAYSSYILIFLYISSLVGCIAIIYKGIRHVIAYTRWIRTTSYSIDQHLAQYQTDPAVYHEILNYIAKGETRNLLLKYPNLYLEIKIPHLWNSLYGTKISIILMTIIAATIVLIGHKDFLLGIREILEIKPHPSFWKVI